MSSTIFSNRLHFAQRLLLLFCSFILCLVVLAFCNMIYLNTFHNITTRYIRILTIAQDLFVFILPVVITVVIISKNPISFLRIGSIPKWRDLILCILILIIASPALDAIIDWNKSIQFPESMKSIEMWMQENEKSANDSVNLLFNGMTIPTMILNILIIGIMAGFCEELFFRGTLQRILYSMPMNVHCAIWLSAIIFSFLHMQFYGFVPRILLGAYFGYLLVWTQNIWIPIIAHTANNSYAVISTYLSQQGYKTEPSATVYDSTTIILIVGSVILTTISIYIYIKYFVHGKTKIEY